MIKKVLIVFFVLLLLAVPVSFVILGASTYGIIAQGSNPVVLIQQLFEGAAKYSTLAVPFFIVSGDLASKGSVSQKIIDTASAFLGHLDGGMGIATIIACAFFGAITGSAMATVVAIGALMLPKLLEKGYPRAISIGIITCAGTLGVMIPPSIPMLQLAISLESSVGASFTAGFIPGLVVALGFCLYVWAYAKKHNIPKEKKLTGKERIAVLKSSTWSLLYPVIILGSIYSGIATPTEAAVISLVYVILVELLIYKTMSIREMIQTIRKSCVSAATLTLTLAAAQVFVWFLTTAQVPAMIYDFTVANLHSKWMFWLIFGLLLLVIGCFTQVTTVVVIIGPMLLGVLQHFGINLLQFSVVVILLSQIGFITPPFGICLFVTMKVAKENLITVFKGCLPFVLIMMLCTIFFIIVPALSTFLPGLIY